MKGRRIAIVGLAVGLAAAAAIVVAALASGSSGGGHGPVSEGEFAEMKAATNQSIADGYGSIHPAPQSIHLVELEVDRTAEGTWAAAIDPTPAARLRVFFVRSDGTWEELAASSGCVGEAELAMPVAVEDSFGTCASGRRKYTWCKAHDDLDGKAACGEAYAAR
jgi:hypothetical protein